MKLKKLWLALLTMTISIACAFSCFWMTACGNDATPPPEKPDGGEEGSGEPEGGEHTHTYADTYSSDETGHWYAVTCGHDVEVKDFAAHTYNSSYVCTVCGYEHTHTYDEANWLKDSDYHWHAATCGHSDAVQKVQHTFVDGVCVCGEREPEQEIPDDDGEQEDRTSETYSGKIYLVGDSTVCSFSDNYYIPRYGYGTQIYNYFNLNSESQVVNLALSGRSSKSFLTETNYTTLTNSISEGDYLIIGFGHNDEKSDEAARYTDANGTHTQATTANGDSFQYVLYENYIKLALDKGATPILCTPIVRYDSSFAYSGSKVHDTTTSDKNNMGGDYSEAIRKLGEATGTTVIDLTTITKNLYTELRDEAAYFHAHTTYTVSNTDETVKIPAGRDDTHINKYGAKMVAYQFALALLDTDCPLKNNVVLNLTAPDFDVDFPDAIKADYEKPNYDGFDPNNTTSTNLGEISGENWYTAVMGDVGGASKLGNLTVTKSDETITVTNTTGEGKIETSKDGFAAAFIQIDKNYDFEISVDIEIKAAASSVSSQSVFGIMLRDDIYVYNYITNLDSNFVLAGALGNGAAIVKRENATLTSGIGGSTSVAAGSTYTAKLTRVGQTVTVELTDSSNRKYTATFTDFDFVSVDNDYMYLCLVGNRGLTVEYSNIDFLITGEAVGA